MPSHPPVTFDDLENALLWVSSAGPHENSALISKATGEIFYASENFDAEDDLPDDVGDDTRYWSVPHKNDLDLGRDLALQFAAEFMPDELRTVEDDFHRRGAYGRFKNLLERTGRLEQWYRYEHDATKSALLAWAAEEGVAVVDQAAG